MMAKRITGALLIASLVTGLQVHTSRAQETNEGALLLTFGVTTSVRAHSNLDLDPSDPGETYRSDTELTFGLLSETRRQRLELSVGTILRAEDTPTGVSSNEGFVDPSFDIEYVREGARSDLSFSANYRERDLDGSTEVFDETLGTTSLQPDSGTRADFRWESELALGTAGPFGVTLTFGQRFVDYRNVTSTSLFDQEITAGTIDFTLTFSPVLTGTAQVFASRYEAEDATNTTRDERALSFGAIYTPNARTEIVGTVGAREIDDSVSGTSDGVELELSYTRALSRGSFTLRGNTAETVAGQRNQFEVSRLFEFPRGELEAAVGVSRTDGTNTEPVFALRYRHDTPRGRITANLDRSVSVTNNAEVQQLTRASLDYLRQLNQTSQLTVGLSVIDLENIGNVAFTERQRGSLTAAINRELTPDWTLSVGATRRYLDENGVTTWDSSVFASVGRTFSIRP